MQLLHYTCKLQEICLKLFREPLKYNAICLLRTYVYNRNLNEINYCTMKIIFHHTIIETIISIIIFN